MTWQFYEDPNSWNCDVTTLIVFKPVPLVTIVFAKKRCRHDAL
jgi:hypothetical protein